jgi:hypothetical protein
LGRNQPLGFSEVFVGFTRLASFVTVLSCL